MQTKKPTLVDPHPQLPTELIIEILKHTFNDVGHNGLPVALRCTEVCKQWKNVIERDLAHAWLDQIRLLANDDEQKKQKIETAINMWKDALKLAPKQMSYLLRQRLGIFFRPTSGGFHPHRARHIPIELEELRELPNMEMTELPYWKVWHSNTSDPFGPINYLKTCLFQPDWFRLLYTTRKKKFLSTMDISTVSRGSTQYFWWFFLLHLPFLESLLTLWILAFQRESFFAQLWIPTDNLVSSEMIAYMFIHLFAFTSTEISVGIWTVIPFRIVSALFFGILAYGIKYILKSMLLMIVSYALAGVYYCIPGNRHTQAAEILAGFAFILVYPALGTMLVITFAAFPWEGKTRTYFIGGFGLLLFSYLFYDFSINLTRFLW